MPRYIDVDELERNLEGTEYDICSTYESDGFTFNAIMDVVDRTKTADVAPVVHGMWIENKFGFLECEKCKYERIKIPLVEWMPYCPKCGAKMDLEEWND